MKGIIELAGRPQPKRASHSETEGTRELADELRLYAEVVPERPGRAQVTAEVRRRYPAQVWRCRLRVTGEGNREVIPGTTTCVWVRLGGEPQGFPTKVNGTLEHG